MLNLIKYITIDFSMKIFCCFSDFCYENFQIIVSEIQYCFDKDLGHLNNLSGREFEQSIEKDNFMAQTLDNK